MQELFKTMGDIGLYVSCISILVYYIYLSYGDNYCSKYVRNFLDFSYIVLIIPASISVATWLIIFISPILLPIVTIIGLLYVVFKITHKNNLCKREK